MRSRSDLVLVESYSIDVNMNNESISKALTEIADRGFKARTTFHFMSSQIHANCLLACRRISIIFASEASAACLHALTLSVANTCLHFDNTQVVKLVVFPPEIIPVMQAAKGIGFKIKEFTWLSINKPSFGLVGISKLPDR